MGSGSACMVLVAGWAARRGSGEYGEEHGEEHSEEYGVSFSASTPHEPER